MFTKSSPKLLPVSNSSLSYPYSGSLIFGFDFAPSIYLAFLPGLALTGDYINRWLFSGDDLPFDYYSVDFRLSLSDGPSSLFFYP